MIIKGACISKTYPNEYFIAEIFYENLKKSKEKGGFTETIKKIHFNILQVEKVKGQDISSKSQTMYVNEEKYLKLLNQSKEAVNAQ